MKREPIYTYKVSNADIIVHLLLCLVVVGFFTIWGAIRRRRVVLEIYDNEVVVRRGRMSKQTLTFPIRHIQSINIDQGAGGRMFGYGDITIETAGANRCRLAKMAKPHEIKKNIYDLGATS